MYKELKVSQPKLTAKHNYNTVNEKFQYNRLKIHLSLLDLTVKGVASVLGTLAAIKIEEKEEKL